MSKQYGARRTLSEFTDNGWKAGSIDGLLKRSHKTGTIIVRKPDSDRPRSSSSSGGPCAGFESDGNARERRSRSFLYNGNVVPVVFFCILQLLTVIFHGSSSVIKLIRLLASCSRSAKFYYGPYVTNVLIKNEHAISRK